MTKSEEIFSGLDINQISGDHLKDELLKAVRVHLKSDDVKIFIENGSSIGIEINFYR